MANNKDNKPKIVVLQNSDNITTNKKSVNKSSDINKKSSKNKKTKNKKQISNKKPVNKISSKSKNKKKSIISRYFSKLFSLIKKLNIKIILLLIIVIAVITGIYFIITSEKISFINESDSLYSTDFGVNSKADFYMLNKNIFYCTKDTATLLDKKGNQIWSDTFSMVSPALLGEGNYVGIADIKNKVLNVYNESGKVYSIDADGNITAFAINKVGAVALICKNAGESDYNVSVYNSAGQKMFMGSYVSTDGVPMTIDISDDSTKVAVGFLNVSSINISSKILFYSTDKAIAAKIENSDAMFAAVNCDKEMVGCIKFLDNDSAIIATDKSLINIGGNDVAAYEQNWKTDFSNYVTALDIIDSKYVAVAYGDKVEASEDSIEKGSVFWYNTKNGNVKGSTLLNSSVLKLSSGLGTSIAKLEDNTFVALKPNGSEIWRYDGVQNINNILFYNDLDTIAVVSSNKMTLTDVKNGANNTEVIDEEETKAEKEIEQTTEKVTEKETKKPDNNSKETETKA